MSELISRQKLIEGLMECSMVGIGKRNPKDSKEEMLYEDYIKLDTVLELIESQPPADQWIPCSERLPKKNGRYLVTQKRYPIDDNKHEKLLSIETDYAEFSVSENKWRRANMFEVTAWMPAEPYKGVE